MGVQYTLSSTVFYNYLYIIVVESALFILQTMKRLGIRLINKYYVYEYLSMLGLGLGGSSYKVVWLQ